MANLDMAQIITIAQSLPQPTPVIITAGSLMSLITQLQAATGSFPTVPFYSSVDGSTPSPVDLTQFPGV